MFADPRRGHPVAGFGRVAAALERRWHADSRLVGAGYTLTLVGAAAAVGRIAERAAVRHPVLATAVTAAATWVVLGGASLARHGAALADELGRGDLVSARRRLPALCGRDPEALDAAGAARAGTESLAENTSDAVVAPLFWGAVAGAPGLLAYRAVNTLDAMVGYRSPRHARFGWAAARLDDAANVVPARLAAALFTCLAPAVGGSPRAALAAWRRDARAHPSPNAGSVEAAAAGALGVWLGGRTVYPHGVEDRLVLGSGPGPGPDDLRRAVRLARLVSGVAMSLAALSAAWVRPLMTDRSSGCVAPGGASPGRGAPAGAAVGRAGRARQRQPGSRPRVGRQRAAPHCPPPR